MLTSIHAGDAMAGSSLESGAVRAYVERQLHSFKVPHPCT